MKDTTGKELTDRLLLAMAGIAGEGTKFEHFTKGEWPAEKPVSWHERAIINSTDAEQLVLDPFCGSGSALVCAKKLRREVLGIEINPVYADLARHRIALVRNNG